MIIKLTRWKIKIQRVELDRKYYSNIHCPFCGQLVYEQEQEQAQEDLDAMLKPCPHTLFYAYDDDLHYRSRRFDEIKSIVGKSSDDISSEEIFEGWDSFTDDVEIVDSLKFAMYVGMPSGYGSYLGFATLDDWVDRLTLAVFCKVVVTILLCRANSCITLDEMPFSLRLVINERLSLFYKHSHFLELQAL